MIKTIFAVQIFLDDKWQSVYLSSFGGDAQDAYQDALEVSTGPVRLVWFGVLGADFVATHARDFGVVDSRPEPV